MSLVALEGSDRRDDGSPRSRPRPRLYRAIGLAPAALAVDGSLVALLDMAQPCHQAAIRQAAP